MSSTDQAVATAATRAILKGFTGMTAGQQAMLGEAGRTGLFTFVAGNQSAAVSADPDEAITIAPAAQASGSAGAWRRAFDDGVALATWAGVAATGTGDYAPQLNRLLAHPLVAAMLLPAGTIAVAKSVEVPPAKSLFGAGQLATILKAVAFVAVDTPVGNKPHRNSLVWLAEGGRQSVHDLTVDGSKQGVHYINGINAVQTDGAMIERVTAKDVTGYAFWAVGDGVPGTDVARTTVRACLAVNCHVGFETQNGRTVRFLECDARQGDGDIECSSYFHPYSGCRNVTYRDGTGFGNALNGITLVGDANGPVEDVTFDNMKLRLTRPGAQGIVVQSYSHPVRRVTFANLDVEASGVALLASIVPGNPQPLDLQVIGGRLTSVGETISVPATARLQLDGVTLVPAPSGPAALLLPILAEPGATVIVNGGVWDLSAANLDANGRPRIAWPRNVIVQALPRLIGAVGLIPPWGVGHTTGITLAANDSGGAGQVSTIGNGVDDWITVLPPGTYEVRIDGTYRQSSTAGGLRLVISTSGGGQVLAGKAEAYTSESGGAVSKALTTADANLITTSVDAANASRPFSAVARLRCTADQTNLNVQAGAWLAGNLTIEAGSRVTIERVA